ncbi:MAG: hypothetical protein UU73_C0001G0092 [Candidatus Daviesbacteria bacterium GW2011_GWA1_41_61]|uniref:Uncharacterized protein n=1 Tax=Candidatus Daviesbacteria bacterium GW2011_GWA2_40_9 TaxID=1618424 RepID=A0A0G0WFB2_9BACT|nr:MAG: hypothetical protein UU26_C0002G0011 [Candidatus Daviesbacteria bacterium GW2011_GWC1_40_9]KKR82985.1 MAG: hypothetical protein UU29_C0008G0094 [Candidatus Daviesbacteria bacterium GW2011_GWA2_40_9]KKR92911.1 MAG: hypothetical protein UU44_C0004G0093 [Candidatus Daviesbacteria bacterium GW2011_GWB1_41_15]KKS15455.1 MAG: hypothetical protein UU73_C0001G0092 [Candidatus Daviesbacteria bacterium GW2011_GWA1_41_61]
MKHLKQEEERRPRKRVVKFIRLGAVILLAVLFLEIWAVNRLSTYGDKIQDIKSAKMALDLENQVLENQIAQQSSLASIETKAVSLGFTAVKSWQYLKPLNLASAY